MIDASLAWGVQSLARAVRLRDVAAVDVAQLALERMARRDGAINAVTRTLAERGLAEARAIDARIARGEDPGPLAGVPYGVKDLFDVEGIPTTAGSASRVAAPPASRDAEAIRRLQAAGAVLLATLNMDEFAYGFVTDNAAHGLTRNPHDIARFAGGSSGGSAAAVAAGMLPFSLGSDTNGSIRIPASFCGVWGLKPTHGSLPMGGVFPFVETLDDIGPIAASIEDLMLVDSVLRDGGIPTGDAQDPMRRPALLGGWFARNLTPVVDDALRALSGKLGTLPVVELPDVERARSAAFLITAYEGSRLHLNKLRANPLAYDPATRDRLIAGAALPDALYHEALAFRAVFARHVEAIFERHDVLIAPATLGPAPRIDEPFVLIEGDRQPARANLGLFTQPISYVGLPVVTAPISQVAMPFGLQLIGPRGSDRRLLAFARSLHDEGVHGSYQRDCTDGR